MVVKSSARVHPSGTAWGVDPQSFSGCRALHRGGGRRRRGWRGVRGGRGAGSHGGEQDESERSDHLGGLIRRRHLRGGFRRSDLDLRSDRREAQTGGTTRGGRSKETARIQWRPAHYVPDHEPLDGAGDPALIDLHRFRSPVARSCGEGRASAPRRAPGLWRGGPLDVDAPGVASTKQALTCGRVRRTSADQRGEQPLRLGGRPAGAFAGADLRETVDLTTRP
jgi:hypothetical protein